MKIAHLIVDLDTGGAEMMLLKLMQRMRRDYFQNVVISMVDQGMLLRRFQELSISVHTLGMGYGQPTLSGALRLFKLLRQVKPDVLQTWMYHADVLGLVVGMLAGVPRIAWNIRASQLDLQASHLSYTTFRLGSWLSSRPNLVIFNSYAGEEYHRACGYHPRLAQVIPNGFDLERFRPDVEARPWLRMELGLDRDVSLIGLAARYDPNKDHVTFLRAAADLRQRFPNAHFVLVGKGVIGQNAPLVELIVNLKLQDRVHLLGERADVSRILAGLDVLTLSSIFEGFSNVIGEAMACGIPVVTTDTGDSAFIVGDAGIVVPPRDPQALADGWARVLALPPDERQAMGLRGRERIAAEFSIERVTARYEELYESLAT